MIRPLATSTVLVCALCVAAHGASPVVADPAEWSFGVRPQRHLVTMSVEFSPARAGERIEIERVRSSCECFHVHIEKPEGDADDGARLRVVMDTDEFVGIFRMPLYVRFRAPEACEVVYPISGWIRESTEAGSAEVYVDDGGDEFVAWWDATRASAPGASSLVKVRRIENDEQRAGVAQLLRDRRKRRAPGAVTALFDGGVTLFGAGDAKRGLTGFLNLRGNMKSGSLLKGPCKGCPDSGGDEAATPLPEARDGATARLEIHVFYFSRCAGCARALRAIEALQQEAGSRVGVTLFDTDRDASALRRAFATASTYEDAPRVLPGMIAFVGDAMIPGAREIASRVRAVAAAQLQSGGTHLAVRDGGDGAPLGDTVSGISLWIVLAAGLVDGVNPCAFAAMVLLVSLLSTLGRGAGRESPGPRHLLLGGGAFIAGVFAAYFLAGLALFEGALAARGSPMVEWAVFWCVWAVAVAGFVFSVSDAHVARTSGRAGDMVMKVPDPVRQLMARVARSRLAQSGLVAGGFVAGVVIAALEGICTGQMYLPAIKHMAATPQLAARGVLLLVAYNALFVLPLLVILGVAVAGVHFHRLSAFLARRAGAAKLLMACVFLSLAVAMLVGRYG